MGPAPDPLKDYRGLGEESGEQGLGDDDDRIGATTTAAGRAAARGADGGDPGVATVRAGNKGRRRTTGERMAPSSEWRCVALFFNNNTAPSHAAPAFPGEGMGVGECSQGQEVPVPAAVNSLAWSSLEERLFTGDTVGFVKVGSKNAEPEPRNSFRVLIFVFFAQHELQPFLCYLDFPPQVGHAAREHHRLCEISAQ